MSPQTQLLALSAVLFVLVGLLVVVVLRLRSAWRQPASGREARLREEAFMATAVREALTEGATADAARAAAAGPSTALPAGELAGQALEVLPAAVLVADESGVVRVLNGRARALFGLPAPATGRSIRETITGHPVLLDLLERTRRTRTASGPVRLGLADVTAAAGADRAAEARGGPDTLVDVDAVPFFRAGELEGVACVWTDVTAEVRAGERDGQVSLDRHMAALASGLAHEVANSLTALQGYARLIDGSGLSELDRSSLQAVQEETSAIANTLDGFRRLVRPIAPGRDVVPVAELVRDAIRIVEGEQTLSPGAIVADAPPELAVVGHPVLLEEALAHIIRNAVEACREADGTRVVSVSARGDANREAALVTVRDEGPGVAPVDRVQLFQPFFSTKPGRSGLGLAHARHIVLAHGGTIEASHPEQGGLLVTLALPLADTAAPDR